MRACTLLLLTLLPATIASPAPAPAQTVRVKDITSVAGVRSNRLTGIGLVMGLGGTGGEGPTTRQMLLNFLQREGLRADPLQRLQILNNTQFRTENVGVVMVTANLPPFARRGAEVDVSVTAMDAKSLQGGELLETPLTGVDGKIYALASGVLGIGGFSAEGEAAAVQSNQTTRGHILNGATIEREVPFQVGADGVVRLLIRHPDFNTANRIATEVNRTFPGAARALDAGTVDVIVPRRQRLNTVGFVSAIQQMRVEPGDSAQVVIDENSGTIIVGRHVRISAVAINHGNLRILTSESPQVSQPGPFSEGQTTVVPRTGLDVQEERRPIAVFEESVTVGDLAEALNALGVTPRDLGSILRQLHKIGALHAHVTFN